MVLINVYIAHTIGYECLLIDICVWSTIKRKCAESNNCDQNTVNGPRRQGTKTVVLCLIEALAYELLPVLIQWVFGLNSAAYCKINSSPSNSARAITRRRKFKGISVARDQHLPTTRWRRSLVNNLPVDVLTTINRTARMQSVFGRLTVKLKNIADFRGWNSIFDKRVSYQNGPSGDK